MSGYISTIEDILPRFQETTNGEKTVFSADFNFISSDFILVYLGNTKQTSGYTIDTESNSVTFAVAPVVNTIVTIVRAIPVSWEDSDAGNNHGTMDKDSFDKIFSLLVGKMQTLKEEISRCVKTPIYSDKNGEQVSEFFLEQITDALAVLSQAQDSLALIQSTSSSAIESVNNALESALSQIQVQVQAAAASATAAANSATLAQTTVNNALGDIEDALNEALAQLNLGLYYTKEEANGTFVALQGNQAVSGTKTFSGNLRVSYPISDDLADQTVPSTAWVKSKVDVKADDDTVVHKDGNEVITGKKVFNSTPQIRNNLTPSTATIKDSLIEDTLITASTNTDGYIDGMNIVRIQQPSGNRELRYRAGFRNSSNTTNIWPGINMGITIDDKTYVSLGSNDVANAPHPAASIDTSSTGIMTVGRAVDPSQNFNLLHRSGDEQFHGIKTLKNNNPRFGFQHTEVDVTTIPTEQKSSRIFIADKNAKWTAEIANYQNTAGGIITQMTANNGDQGVASLQILCKKDGTKYATCPTPPGAADNSTKIATTAWVNTFVKNQGIGVQIVYND